METYTYRRNQTGRKYLIGNYHYLEVPKEECWDFKVDRPKKWIICPKTKYRYYHYNK